MPQALADLDWNQVRVFLAVARAGRLPGAAERLGMTVSTVSRRLDRLEEDLGLHLFDRSHDGTAPTAAAEGMLPAAEEMERALAGFAAAADAVESTAEGVVRVSTPPGVADAFVAPLLARLRESFPRVVVELDASVGYADLTRRDADIAIRALRPRSGDLVAKRLTVTRAAALASPGYAAELGTLERATDARWIVWGRELMHIPTGRWLATHVGEGPHVALRTSHFASQLRAAAAGLGVVLAAEPFCHVHRLVPIAFGPALAAARDALPVEELWLVGHRALRAVPRIAAVWGFLEDLFAHPERLAEADLALR
ncbi:MAG: LysR family transcriptional regulator [Myxococcales bacterium]|nr:LysR family transcriptional regulator [Myxococcales bacterium]MCB9731859.1 LysR family transcriptional regulator [Deltaproteobacteria bacterium]